MSNAFSDLASRAEQFARESPGGAGGAAGCTQSEVGAVEATASRGGGTTEGRDTRYEVYITPSPNC